ncbi:DNA-binding transcriptional LysR family regulator [Pseudacidovorax intermedius]|uniref:DNA-binding transcriptional LysR family regulator n=1 Tax=Pseudacidovorax intermedius TaxID=433924 RepID=A0A370FMP8_9BURK|nr:LysR substrate-binding domain-containing protein [Pseudacidovorax intermedius]RDI29002.1 DNA-binding transcriptional LysR family regulator [Pseudacidovorax intermedius]
MRLRHIEVFNAVMLTGSVSAAARLINVTQPAVSRTLQHAELQLGFALFRRAKGRLIPTAEAQALYPRIERLFAQLDEVQRLASQLRHGGEVAGELRILAVMALTHEVLPRALVAFRAKHPAVAIRVEALHTPQIVSALLLREADIGFAFSALPHAGLVNEPVADSRMVCVAPRGLLPAALVKAGRLSLPDLADVPVIALDGRDPLGLGVAQACREAGVGLQAVVTVQTYHAALAMAHHGLGAALVDGCTALSADPAKVDRLALVPALPVPVRVLRAEQAGESVPMRTLLACVRQVLTASTPELG